MAESVLEVFTPLLAGLLGTLGTVVVLGGIVAWLQNAGDEAGPDA